MLERKTETASESEIGENETGRQTRENGNKRWGRRGRKYSLKKKNAMGENH